MRVTVVKTRPDHPAVAALIKSLDRLMLGRYPLQSNHLDSAAVLLGENVHMVRAEANGEVAGCGAVKIMPGDYGELKRMFVKPEFRGRGVADRILEQLETWLAASSVCLCRLETGACEQAAIRFYRRHGYREAGPFGAYQLDPNSLYMERNLDVRL